MIPNSLYSVIKTFKLLLAFLLSDGQVLVAITTITDIPNVLLPGGRTPHSQFVLLVLLRAKMCTTFRSTFFSYFFQKCEQFLNFTLNFFIVEGRKQYT